MVIRMQETRAGCGSKDSSEIIKRSFCSFWMCYMLLEEVGTEGEGVDFFFAAGTS